MILLNWNEETEEKTATFVRITRKEDLAERHRHAWETMQICLLCDQPGRAAKLARFLQRIDTAYFITRE